jgi:predicted AlkP superfamily phosphohydrolase/phosphomutase
VFLNVQGREPNGVIAPEALEATIAELSAALAAIPDEQGRPLVTRVIAPKEVYQQVNGFAPDLIVYFGDLHWRTVGGLGYGTHYTLENDTGPDDANHAEEGMFIHVDPRHAERGEHAPRSLMDITPMVLGALGVGIPSEMQGRK